jgi:hypothetical protein
VVFGNQKKNTWSCDVSVVTVPSSSSHGCIMKKTKLESFVKQSFHMSVMDFMKQKVEKEGLTDREIAHILPIHWYTVGTLRRQFGLKKPSPFFRHFERRYGPGAVKRFKNIIEDPSTSLADVGRSFGFTRETARQIYHKIYGFPYTEAYQKKLRHRRSKADSLKLSSSRRLIHLKTVKDKLTTMGLAPSVVFQGNSPLLVTNNNVWIAVFYNSKLRQIGAKKYFAVKALHKQKQGCDVFILTYLTKGVRGYFIIPNRYMPRKGTTIAISADDTNGKYTRFKDAWHLLVNR